MLQMCLLFIVKLQDRKKCFICKEESEETNWEESLESSRKPAQCVWMWFLAILSYQWNSTKESTSSDLFIKKIIIQLRDVTYNTGCWCSLYYFLWQLLDTYSSSILLPFQAGDYLLNSCVCALSHLSCVRLFETPWTVACQTPLSMGFSRQEHSRSEERRVGKECRSRWSPDH